MSTNTANLPAAEAEVLFLFAESPVHAGSGAVKAAVDLPIQRSVQTEWPILNDGTVRGSLRRLATDRAGVESAKEWFGIEDFNEKDPHPGRFSTPDAEVLLFPVASARGMTAWVTCPTALRYFQRKLDMFVSRLAMSAQKAIGELSELVPKMTNPGQISIPKDSAIAWPANAKGERRVVLESDSYSVDAFDCTALATWLGQHAVPLSEYWADRMRRHLAIVDDEAFRHYVLTKTDIRTRIRVEEGRVMKGALWTEENLPMDTVMYAVLAASQGCGPKLTAFCESIKLQTRPVLQLGGDQNLGRGMMRICRLGA